MGMFGLFAKRPSAVMQGDDEGGGGQDAVLQQLAYHIAAQAFADGELPDGGTIPGGQRDRFIRYPALSRSVDLICSLCAQMVCNGGLTVRDRQDNLIENRRTKATIDLLSHSPDGGITPAATFIEDVMADYLLDGNALVVPAMMGATMVPIGLTRYRPHGAHTISDGGPLAYQAMPSHGSGSLDTISARDVIHIRWPLKQRGQLGENGREYFAVAPVTLFAREMLSGILQSDYTRRRFAAAPVTQVWSNVDIDKIKTGELTGPQREQMVGGMAAVLARSPVFAAFASDMKEISASPVHEHVLTSRELASRTVTGMYGLPEVLVEGRVGQWTRGVNEQVMKMAWRSSISVHLNRLLYAFQTRLLMAGERFVVDPTEFVRGDASGISEMLMASQGDSQRDPVASRPELRHMMGLPRQPDGEIVSTRVERDKGMDGSASE